MPKIVGTISTIRRYPVKSMQGEVLKVGQLTERGIVGDRLYAIVDMETGFVASGKHPRLWGKLLECRAEYLQEPQAGAATPEVVITLPDGRRVSSERADCDQLLSEFVGRAVRLSQQAPVNAERLADRSEPNAEAYEGELQQEPLATAAPSGSFFDYSPIHLLTTATLGRFQALYPAGRFDPARFRPNVIVDTGPMQTGFVENDWVERNIGLEKGAVVNVLIPCPRCIMTTLPQNGLPADRQILRTVAQHNTVPGGTLAPGHLFRAVAGVYAKLVEIGGFEVGEAVVLSEE